ncbi:Beta-glucosidase 1 [Sphaceloma murrayae]|uniref:Probable beta-glucosidase G n=1 Tax=Sphaceloma murrayae TaxID=2082308 RepID=A0A2K1R2N5_9PEZI|nr:Beta-glucosidase 1 [Sphaceloma murrayae]
MRSPSLLSLPLLAAVPATYAQSCAVPGTTEAVFSNVQPLNTTILGPYGHSPSVLPSPNATGVGGWEAAIVKARAFVAQLTLEEKARMVTGEPGPCIGNIQPVERLGFPGLCLQDGPLALRTADYVSVFSAGVSAASTWDKAILYERGLAMGREFRAKGAHVALSPVAGPLGRSAYSGRNWEGFSADPYLTGVSMHQTIKGLQDAGVQATAKHYIGNEQETQRNPTFNRNGTITDKIQESLSSNIDDRTMHEIYLWPFADAVKVGAAAFMCSYQRLNGSYACENTKAQNGILKGELGFQGYIMSDWGATHSGVASVEGGLDMNMPGGLGLYGLIRGAGSFFGGNITLAVNNGSIPVSRVDDMVTRIMTPYYWLGQDVDHPSVDPSCALLNTFSPPSTWTRQWNLTGESNRDVRSNHGELIRRHGAAATILLKNERNALPLKAPKSIAVFGNDAAEPTQGLLNQRNYEFGTLTAGGGSGTGRLSYLITPLEAIRARAAHDDALVQYWLNNTLITSSNVTDLWVPKVPEVCLVFLKTWAEEAADRSSLNLDWNGTAVVNSVANACNNTIVVTHSSGINLLPFADHPNVTAIIAAHYPGQESGNSLVDVLYGYVNPSGKLPYTIAYNGSDYNAPPTTAVNTTGKYDWQSWFDERLEVDYRYFDAKNISVRYPFGFGLSYTTFSAADLTTCAVDANIASEPEDLPILPGGNPALWETVYSVNVTISNTGAVGGAAVAQLYLGFPSSTPAGTPPKQLRGFEKVYLEPGVSEVVTFNLMRRDLSYWDIISQQWLIPTGTFRFSVGFSSRDLQASADAVVVSA